MLNDRSSILSLLETRRSGKPRELVGPGPSAEELERILTIAARTPDHGKLAPWRFVTVAADQRERWRRSSATRLPRRNPTPSPPNSTKAERVRQQCRPVGRAGFGARVPDHKIPGLGTGIVCAAPPG